MNTPLYFAFYFWYKELRLLIWFPRLLYKWLFLFIDIDIGGILDLIKLNAKYNAKLIKSEFKVLPLDFTATWSPQLTNEINETDIIIAADGK